MLKRKGNSHDAKYNWDNLEVAQVVAPTYVDPFCEASYILAENTAHEKVDGDYGPCWGHFLCDAILVGNPQRRQENQIKLELNLPETFDSNKDIAVSIIGLTREVSHHAYREKAQLNDQVAENRKEQHVLLY